MAMYIVTYVAVLEDPPRTGKWTCYTTSEEDAKARFFRVLSPESVGSYSIVGVRCVDKPKTKRRMPGANIAGGMFVDVAPIPRDDAEQQANNARQMDRFHELLRQYRNRGGPDPR